jgi:hypothetical protein
MNTCDTCRFWTRDKTPRKQVIGECSCPKFTERCSTKTLSDGLGYGMGDDCGSYFETGEKFGCIHHEAKP